MRPSPPSVDVARLTYLIVCVLAGFAIAASSRSMIPSWVGVLAGLCLAGFFICVERLMSISTLRGFSTATFGLAIGLLCAFLLNRVGMSDLVRLITIDEQLGDSLALALNVAIYASLGFLGAALALRSNQEDFSFIIPYVRFRQDASSGQPLLFDAEVVMDGRLPALMGTRFLNGRLLVPQFVLDELQVMANSPSPLKRQRALRGLEILSELQKNPALPLAIQDSRGVSENEAFPARLVQLAKLLGARLITTDENLTKIALLQGADILNLDDLAAALKPSVVVGETLRLSLVRAGKDDHQAVGYLPDGTMIVVNQAIHKIGTSQDVSVISTIQTNAGQMVFAEIINKE